MHKVSIHMKSGKTITLFSEKFITQLNSTPRSIAWEGGLEYTLFHIDLDEIEAVTAKLVPWYHHWYLILVNLNIIAPLVYQNKLDKA